MEGSTVKPFFELYINIAGWLQEADMAAWYVFSQR